MKKLTVACMNNIQYCKFPQGINNINEFIEFLNTNYHSFVELEFLCEEGCVAPFYIEENFKTEKQYWNPSHIRTVKECEVTILKRYEYKNRLEKVINEKCIHCVHYLDDMCDEDLNSFIDKIDLNGDCYAFEKK